MNYVEIANKLFFIPGENDGRYPFSNSLFIDDEIKVLIDTGIGPKLAAELAKEKKIDLMVAGPEAPLADGVVDAFEQEGIKAFGPCKEAAKLEADKAFAKHLMRSCSISTAEGRVFDRFDDAKAFIASRDEAVVIKAAGLAAGKGVFVCDDPSDGIIAAEKIMCDNMFGDAGKRIVVEESNNKRKKYLLSNIFEWKMNNSLVLGADIEDPALKLYESAYEEVMLIEFVEFLFSRR